MNIVFATDDAGVEMCLTSIYSVIINNPDDDLTICVFVNELAAQNRRYFDRLAARFERVVIRCINVDAAKYLGMKVPREDLSAQAYFRYFAPELLPSESRALYLDIDTLCVGPIHDLYWHDIENVYLAAVKDLKVSREYESFDSISGLDRDDYYNTGVLLFNLEKMRSNEILRNFVANATTRRHELIPDEQDIFVDQTVANLTFGKPAILDGKYNVLIETVVSGAYSSASPVILHFSGIYKPLGFVGVENAQVRDFGRVYEECYSAMVEAVGVDHGELVAKSLRSVATQYRSMYQERCTWSGKVSAWNEEYELANQLLCKDIDDLRAENRSLRAENEGLRAENESLRVENVSLQTENVVLRTRLSEFEATPLRRVARGMLSSARFVDRELEGWFLTHGSGLASRAFLAGIDLGKRAYHSWRSAGAGPVRSEVGRRASRTVGVEYHPVERLPLRGDSPGKTGPFGEGASSGPGTIANVAVIPFTSPDNLYLDLLKRAIVAAGFSPVSDPAIAQYVWLHWYDNLGSSEDYWPKMQRLADLANDGKKILYQIHNARPHDTRYPELAEAQMVTIAQFSSVITAHCRRTDVVVRRISGEPGLAKMVYLPMPNYVGAYGDISKVPCVDNETLRLLLFGMLRPYKGIETLISAVKGLKGVHVDIVGPATDEVFKDRLVSQIADSENIHIEIGFVEGRDIPLLLSKYHAMVLPYESSSALNSGAAMLAFSYARTVISSGNGTLDELNDPSLYFSYENDPSGDNVDRLRDAVQMVQAEYGGRYDDLLEVGKRAYEAVVNSNGVDAVASGIRMAVEVASAGDDPDLSASDDAYSFGAM